MAFLGLWRPFGTVLGSILWSVLDAFWLRNRAVDRIAKTTKSDDVIALFNDFSGAGGSKIDENVTESSLEHQPCSKSVSGASWDQFWSHCGSILASKICSKSKLEIQERFLRKPSPGGECQTCVSIGTESADTQKQETGGASRDSNGRPHFACVSLAFTCPLCLFGFVL